MTGRRGMFQLHFSVVYTITIKHKKKYQRYREKERKLMYWIEIWASDYIGLDDLALWLTELVNEWINYWSIMMMI